MHHTVCSMEVLQPSFWNVSSNWGQLKVTVSIVGIIKWINNQLLLECIILNMRMYSVMPAAYVREKEWMCVRPPTKMVCVNTARSFNATVTHRTVNKNFIFLMTNIFCFTYKFSIYCWHTNIFRKGFVIWRKEVSQLKNLILISSTACQLRRKMFGSSTSCE